MRIVELSGLLETEPSATPLPWQQPSHPRSLLASFSSETSLACPRKLNDRQLLECLHVFTSHHLKALQGVDAKYRTPAAFDVADVEPHAPSSNLAHTAWLSPRAPSPPPAHTASAAKPGGGRYFSCPSQPAAERRLPSRATHSAEAIAMEKQPGATGAGGAARRLCESGSTWRHMPGPMLAQFVNALGTALRLSDGTRVLDAGAACGHNLAVLQARHGNKLRAMGVDGSLASVRHARHTAHGGKHGKAAATFCHGDVRTLEGVADDSFDAAFEAGTFATLETAEEVCAARHNPNLDPGP